jgi:hypothetical protein
MKLPQQVNSYISNKGWMNSAIMLDWLKEIVIPYFNKRAGALLLDDYKAHWTSEVDSLCKLNNIELIHVPPTTTSECQPLDISVMGPFKQIRQSLSNDLRWKSISVLDDRTEAVHRAQKAWDLIKKETIIRGWEQACPPLQGQL